MEIVLSALIVLFASVVQGTVGFGFALISVPFLSLILPFQMVVPLVVIFSLVTNLVVIHSLRNSISIKKIWLLIVSGLIGIPFGVYILNYVDAEILKSAVGVLIVLTSLLMIKGYKIKFKQERLSYCTAGLISGLLNGSLSMSGPPIVLFLNNQGCDKDEFRGNIAIYSAITNTITIAVFIYCKILTVDMVGIIGYNVAAIVFGTFLGVLVSGKIHDRHFNKMVLILISIMGFVTIVKSLM